MTVAVRGGSIHTSSTGSASIADASIPSIALTGDLIIATLQVAGTNAVLATPAGWTTIAGLTAAQNSSSSLRGCWRRAQAGDAGATFELPFGVSARWAVNVVAYYDTGGVPVTVEQVVFAVANATASPVTPAITPFSPTSMAVAVVGGTAGVAGAQPTITAAATWSLRSQSVSTSASLKNAVQAVATKSLTGTALVPAATHTLSTGTMPPVNATMILSNVNVLPVANAGADRSVAPGAAVVLSGTGSSDPDGGITAYHWTQVSGTTVTLTGATSSAPSFTAPTLAAGATLVFGLVVTDDRAGDSPQDTMTVTVAPTGSARIRVSGAWTSKAAKPRYSNAWH